MQWSVPFGFEKARSSGRHLSQRRTSREDALCTNVNTAQKITGRSSLTQSKECEVSNSAFNHPLRNFLSRQQARNGLPAFPETFLSDTLVQEKLMGSTCQCGQIFVFGSTRRPSTSVSLNAPALTEGRQRESDSMKEVQYVHLLSRYGACRRFHLAWVIESVPPTLSN